MFKEKHGRSFYKKLKILIVTQYFWPENFRINELCEEFTNLGHNITILTGYPNYPIGEIYEVFLKDKKKFNNYKGAKVIRVPILPRKKNKLTLSLNYISFLFSSIFFGYFKLKNDKFDIVFTLQLSPVTVGITSAFYSKLNKCPNVLWTLDLWPNTLVALNIIKKDWQINLLKLLVNWIYSNCDVILAQSKSMLKEIRKYPSVTNNAYYFPSWSDSDLFQKKANLAPEIKNKKSFSFLFAGNIGEAQDFLSIVNAVKILSQKNLNNFRIIIIGEGSKKSWFKNEIKKQEIEKYFELLGSYPIERMPSFFKHADALIISLLNRDVFNMTIPGKIQFYLTSGIPIVGMISGEGAKVIKKSKGGLICDSGDHINFSKIMEKVMHLDKKSLKQIGKNGKEYANQEFSKKNLINNLEKIFFKLLKDNSLANKKRYL